MNHFSPCPGCQRHVRIDEHHCPFCGVGLELAGTPAAALPRSRLGRAATFAFGATLAGMTSLASCGGESEEGAGGRAGTDSGGGGSGNAGSGGDGGGVQPVYGSPTDTGGAAGTAGMSGSGGVAGNSGASGAGGMTAGGGAGGSSSGGDGGGIQPLYGAVPVDAGTDR